MKIIKNFINYLLLLTITSLVLAVFVMLLWDNVMPSLFGLKEISFWQSFELNLLSAILIKSTNFSGAITKSNEDNTINKEKIFVKKK